MRSESVHCVFFSIALAALLLSCTISSARSATVSDETLIVPGERLNGYVLGKTVLNQILGALGEPDSDGRIRQTTPHGMVYDTRSHIVYNSYRIVFSIDETTQCLRQIDIWSPSYATAGGVKVGSSEKSVIAEFGRPDNRDDQHGELMLSYSAKGIRFYFSKDRVYLIELFQRSVNSSPISMTERSEPR